MRGFIESLEQYHKQGLLPPDIATTLKLFRKSYLHAVIANGQELEYCEKVLLTLLDLVVSQIQSPFQFPLYHQKELEPFDLYNFGIDFIKTIADEKNSVLIGEPIIHSIEEKLKEGENVIFFANHQIELEPQAITLLLKKKHRILNEALIYVAGHRVTTDPLAVPFSRGINLLSIWSKRHMEHPPEMKEAKLQQNRKTLSMLQQLLDEGRKAIYVAPSGGRDRPDSSGIVAPAPFDAQSIEMFLLIGRHSKRPVHFYPMAISTYPLLPPPDVVLKELIEPRLTRCAPIGLAIGKALSEELLQPCSGDSTSKREQRSQRAEIIWRMVCDMYQKLPNVRPVPETA